MPPEADRCRTIEIQAGTRTITAADPVAPTSTKPSAASTTIPVRVH
jgi:hypothetical protein